MFSISAWCVSYAIEHGGNSPTLREIGEHFNKAHSGVEHHIQNMFRYGIAERLNGKLCIVGAQYLPPQWYLDNINPPMSEVDLSANAWRSAAIIPVPGNR